ncbi:MAG: alpha-amylase family glycosyl hydrolase [Bacteroidales bacterium]
MLACLFSGSVAAQITTDPALPTADEPVTLYFDASGTSLEGYNEDIYAHTGITIGDNNWKYVIGEWGDNNAQPQLTFISTDYYKLEITPTIRDFYGASENDSITEICIVLRSADASQQTSPDIFIQIFESVLSVNLISPYVSPLFVDAGQLIEITAEAIFSETLSLYVDDELIVATNENFIIQNIAASEEPDTKHWIKAVAEAGGEQVSDSAYYYVRGESTVEALPAGVRDGINYIDSETVTLVVHAPYKTSMYVIGDFNNWQVGPEYRMKCTHEDVNDYNTRYWITLENLSPGEEYAFQYLIDEELKLADAYAEKILDPWNDQYIPEETYPNLKPYPEGKTTGIVSVLQTDQQEYQWQVANFEKPKETDLVIYELLLRDFIDAQNFETLRDSLSYFKRLGVNAIELMPFNEFEGNLSWGYNPSFYFAPDKYYGPEETVKEFIDACHAEGIAVIMDMVLNHAFGQNVLVQMYWDETNNRPDEDNIWFNSVCPHEPYCWGYDFNHQSPATQAFVDSVNSFWINEYKVDGYRFDFTQGFTNTGSGWQYDQERIDILKRMADHIWSVDEDAYVILEHWTENSEEKVLSNYGMMLWANMNYSYNEATMSWHENGKSDFSGISYQQRGWNDPHLVGFMESHDEERMMYRNLMWGNASGSYDIQDTTIALQRQELAANFFYTIPGPKMIWQFGERGYDYSINWPSGEEYDRLTPKPPRWDYMDDWRRNYLFNVNAALIDLKTNLEVFETTDFTLNLANPTKSVILNGNDMDIVVVGNFDVVDMEHTPAWPSTGTWYEFYTQTTYEVTSTNQAVSLEPGAYRLYSSQYLEKPEWLNTSVTEPGEIEAEQMRVYPNPSGNDFNFDLTGTEGAVNIEIYDLYGKLVESADLENEHHFTWKPSQNLPAGIYFARITSSGIHQTVKLVRE